MYWNNKKFCDFVSRLSAKFTVVSDDFVGRALGDEVSYLRDTCGMSVDDAVDHAISNVRNWMSRPIYDATPKDVMNYRRSALFFKLLGRYMEEGETW